MINSIYQLFQNLEKMNIPDRYNISFTFIRCSDPGRTSNVKVCVIDSETGEKYCWLTPTKEIEIAKMDFIKDHIEAMIEQFEEDE